MGLWTLLGVAVVVCALIWRPEDDDSSQPGQDDGRNTQPHPASSLDSHRPIYGTSTPAPARQPLLPPPHSSHYPSQFRSTPTLPPSDVRIVSAPPLPTHRQTWAVDEASSLDSRRPPTYGTSIPAPARQPILPPHSFYYPSQFPPTPTLPPSDARIVSAPPLPTPRQTWAADEASSLDSHRPPIYGTSTPRPARQPLLPLPHSSHYPSQFPPAPVLPPSDVRIVSAPPLPTPRQTCAVDELPLSSVELRERAAEEAKLMRESRLHSERFGRQGFRDAASKLSQISKEHQRAMEEFNQTASEMIYRENNKDREPHEIDLHGLFVKEAELKVEMAILAAERRGDPRVRVIVGQGLHTADGVAKLKPAMECYIDKMRPHSVQTDSLNPGVLVVSLTLDSPDDQGPTKRTKKARAVGRRRSTRSP